MSRVISRNPASGAVPEPICGRNAPAAVHLHQQIAAATGSEPTAVADG